MAKQLLYTYIDNCYGFENQEFNFSTDVQLSVIKSESLILRKKDSKEPLLKDFFGANISDISILIGDNGSGKTTLMKIICRWLCCFSEGRLPQEKGVVVFRQDGRIRYIGFEKGDKLEISAEIPGVKMYTISELSNFTRDLRLLYFSNTMTELNLKSDILSDYSLTHRIIKANENESFSHKDIIANYNREEFHRQVDVALNKDIGDFPVHFLQMEVQNLVKEGQPQAIVSDLLKLWEHYFKGGQEDKITKDKSLIIGLLGALLIGVVKYVLENNANGIGTLKLLERVINFYKPSDDEKHMGAQIEEGFECIKEFLADLILDGGFGAEMKDRIVQFIRQLQSYIQNNDRPLVEQRNSEEQGVTVGQINIDLDNREKFKRFWEAYKKVEGCIEGVGFYWDASSGERNWVSLFSMLANVPGENIWLFLDEPDNTLHPDWQRKLLKKIIDTCNGANYSEKKVQLWISTHSPIMLSDMPGNSVIYLKDKKNMDCQMKETFGQNIYTLFNHAFFLHDGVIGTFASNKILEVIRKLQGVEEELFDIEVKIDSNKAEQLYSVLSDCEAFANILAEPLYKRSIQDSIKKYRKLIDTKKV